MHLISLPSGENNPIYLGMAAANLSRHYRFLHSVIHAATKVGTCEVSHSLIKAFNSHAVAALHSSAGEYRDGPVTVAGLTFPPPAEEVGPLMDSLVSDLNAKIALDLDPTVPAAYALWRINRIHPFENGNGRTARAVCYCILCVLSGGWLPGMAILPETLRNEPARTQHIEALQRADEGDLNPLIGLIRAHIAHQIMGSLPVLD